MIETGWLIENRYTPGPSWWRGTDSPEQWTPDSLKAVRFCRKQDAEAAMATLPDVHMCFVSEHQYGFGDSLAALYREAVEALEQIVALSPDVAQDKIHVVAIKRVADAVLAKAHEVAGAEEPNRLPLGHVYETELVAGGGCGRYVGGDPGEPWARCGRPASEHERQ